jgi:hypothetical protein
VAPLRRDAPLALTTAINSLPDRSPPPRHHRCQGQLAPCTTNPITQRCSPTANPGRSLAGRGVNGGIFSPPPPLKLPELEKNPGRTAFLHL